MLDAPACVHSDCVGVCVPLRLGMEPHLLDLGVRVRVLQQRASSTRDLHVGGPM